MPVSPVRVVERLRSRLGPQFFETLDAARIRAQGRGDVPDPAVGWMYAELLQKQLETNGGALWRQTLRDNQTGGVGSPHIHEAHAVSAVAHWRLTRGLYEFDPDLLEMLAETPLDEVPTGAIRNLPEYAPYFALEGLRFMEHTLHGLWAHLMVGRAGQQALQIVLHHSQDRVLSVSLGMGEGITIEQMVDGAFRASEERAVRGGRQYQASEQEREEGRRITRLALSLLLYLCSSEPDVQGVPKAPPARHQGRGVARYLVPERDNMVQVGFRHGGVIRMWRQAQLSRTPESSGLGAPKAPHIRKAHFALYWTGKGRTIPRVKWIHPIAVNVRIIDDIAVHVRPVESPDTD